MRPCTIRSTLFIGLMFLCSSMSAQQQRLVLVPDGDVPKRLGHAIDLPSGSAVQDELRAIIADLQGQGRLEASVDSCAHDSTTTTCQLHIGPIYRWARLNADGVDPAIASEARFKERYFTGRPLDPKTITRLYESLLDECENNGFPFARIHLDSIRNEGEGMRAALVLEKGRLVRIDSVVVKGTAKVAPRYLRSQIGITPGSPYNEELIVEAGKRLRELPFVSQKRDPYVLFTPEETKLYLFLDARRASSINGILGIQPDPVSGKVGLTGDIDLRLRNALRHGEGIELNWRSLQDKTQDLKVGFEYPYLFNTPFGMDLHLKLFKRDTTFLEVQSRAALQYLFGRNDKFTVFVDDKSSQRLGRLDAAPVGLADVHLLSYGIGIDRQRFDYRFNPRQGIGIAVDGLVGRKRTTTATLDNVDTTPDVKSIQYEVDGKVVWHIPIMRRSTVRLVAQGGAMVNDNLFSNELYRMGGIKSLRGVNEASIICSSFAIGTVEYRFLFEENGNFLLFVDQAWWENQSTLPLVTDTPLGFGVGTGFETKAGIFALVYALSKQGDLPVDLRSGKIHFGFTSLF